MLHSTGSIFSMPQHMVPRPDALVRPRSNPHRLVSLTGGAETLITAGHKDHPPPPTQAFCRNRSHKAATLGRAACAANVVWYLCTPGLGDQKCRWRRSSGIMVPPSSFLCPLCNLTRRCGTSPSTSPPTSFLSIGFRRTRGEVDPLMYFVPLGFFPCCAGLPFRCILCLSCISILVRASSEPPPSLLRPTRGLAIGAEW